MKHFNIQAQKAVNWIALPIALVLLTACTKIQPSTPLTPLPLAVAVTTKTAPPEEAMNPTPTQLGETIAIDSIEQTPTTLETTSFKQGDETAGTGPDALKITSIPPTATGTPREPLDPDAWMTLPVIPSVSDKARQIYQRGLEMGNDPHAFAKVGDCQSITTYFLSYFDMPGYYSLGEYAHLQETIDWFAGSFERTSLSVKGGFNAAAMLSPLRADPQSCSQEEHPLACEFRVHNPSIAIISLEEWWAGDPTKYETYMRQIIEFSIDAGVVPIIATKADNLEGDHAINKTIAQLAWEYDIPMWNFWLVVQPLPDRGVVQKNSSGESDMFHLTHSENYYFYDNQDVQSGWSVRNLTALQVLDAVRLGLSDSEQP